MRRPRLITPLAGLVLGLAVTFAVCEVAFAQSEDEAAEGAEGGAKLKKEDATSALKTVGAYALVAVGFFVIAAAVVKTFSSNLSYPQAKMMLTNLLRTNPHQALMMSKKMEGTFCEAISAALKIGGMTQSQDPKVVASATLPTYDATGQGIVAKFGAVMSKAKLGVMAAVAGAAIGLSGERYLPVVIAVVAVAGFGRLFLFKQELESTILRGRLEVLPEVDGAIVSGRFMLPPPA